MRRAAILAMLLLGMQLIAPLGLPADQGRGRALLTFGFLILAAYTIGELAARLRTPKIVGYLLAGALVGPSVLDLVTAGVIRELAPVSRLAIALIAFLAGAELDWGELRTRGVAILKIMGAELGLSFLGIFVLLYALRGWIPFLNGVPTDEALSFSALFAAVAVIHSPAVTLALLAETGARGPVARTTLSIVLVADVAVVILFSGTLALTRTLAPPSSAVAEMSMALVGWEIGGSVVVGVLLGGLVAVYLRWVRSELLIFAVVVAFFGAEIARLAHVETLLTLLVAGFVTENGLGQKGTELRHAMERAAAPVFVVFFALAGAQIALQEVATFWPLVIPIVLVRGLGIWAGTWLGGRWAGASVEEQRYVWLGLISQAGVAIGLATIVTDVYPERGAQLRTLFLAVMAVNQILGPILFRRALVKAGELGGAAAR